jgi:hypothetical protein
MTDEGAKSRQRGLQQAASVIFALVAVVPLLIFAWTLHALGAIRSTQAQLSLGLALAVALLGFWMFRSLLGRMAGVVQVLTSAVEQATRVRRGPVAAASTENGPRAVAVAADTPVVLHAVPTPVPGQVAVAAPAVLAPPAVASRVAAAAPKRPAPAVAGIGKIRELTEVVRTMDALWHREATHHLNHRVQVSVANEREPLIGKLTEATADGLILEQPDGPAAIAYGRVTAIDRLTG